MAVKKQIPPPPDPTLPARLGAKLAGAMTMLIRHRRTTEDERAARRAEGLKPGTEMPQDIFELRSISADELMNMTDDDVRLDEARSAGRDPMEFVLIAEVREIGWHAFAEGGTKMMHAVHDVACDAVEDRVANYASAIIDKNWDGIGTERNQWMA